MRRIVANAGLVVFALTFSNCSCNTFVGQEGAIKSRWAQVENQLQRRSDLIPSLVESVKGHAAHESGVCQAVAESRAKLAGATTPADTIAAANAQSSALARLRMVVENYPQLTANASFNRLMDELSGTESRIAVEPTRSNERVRANNTNRRAFPLNVTASMFGFTEYPHFQVPPEAMAAPMIDFGT